MCGGAECLGTPVFEPEQSPDTYLVYACSAYAVGRLETVTEVGFSPSGMVDGVSAFVVSLLVDADIVELGASEHRILFGLERLHLERYLREVVFYCFYYFVVITCIGLAWSVARNEQYMLVSELFDSLRLGCYLIECEHLASYLVPCAEAAVYARIVAIVR